MGNASEGQTGHEEERGIERLVQHQGLSRLKFEKNLKYVVIASPSSPFDRVLGEDTPGTWQGAWLLLPMMGLQKWLRNGDLPSKSTRPQSKDG